eukprot:CAMPEP_0113827292 /NCGR_PEP_ID=MMETSP0328-20130328/4692_1 /TAXON_ID=39455 /ORGANISM="Alexandrium minutum" /LENGTH=49 /DNA_ID=CAMNT_0000795277 /DNA_START=77 /DNA_END=226 /DNA_ORIENTATION=- /assembly_acc=CAM_ASM_000350
MATMTYAYLSRSIDKERMYRGVAFDVERMKQKQQAGVGRGSAPPESSGQ